MKLAFVRSGSKGNATLVLGKTAFVQIDMGIAFKRVKEGFDVLGKNPEDLQGLFLTHNHSDHIKNAYMMEKYCGIYASRKTYGKANSFLEDGVAEEIGEMLIMPFSVSHDAPNPLNFILMEGEEKYVHITDTGYLDESLFPLLEDATYYLMESNHDVEMELTSRRPHYMKMRILGDEGHLSNADAATNLTKLVGPHTKGIYLGHMSLDCNTDEVALETLYSTFKEAGKSLEGIEVKCTSQEHMVLGGEG